MPANAGNSFNTAGDLNPSSISQTFIDSVNPSNLNDFYRFNLGSAGYINLSLKGASGNVDLQLIQDLNNNGRAETREILGRSALGGTASDAISVALAPGTHYVQVYANSRVTTNYSLNWSATSLGSTNYTDPTSVKSYFGTEVTRSFFNGRGISTYQTQVGNFLMYGAIADYYTNTYFNNPNSSNGLFGIYSGLGLPTSPIYKQSDGSFVMDFEGGTLINRNGIVTPSYSHRGGDRFDLVGQGAPDGYELQWKNDHSWFSAKSVGQPTGAVRRVNNGWVQEFTGTAIPNSKTLGRVSRLRG